MGTFDILFVDTNPQVQEKIQNLLGDSFYLIYAGSLTDARRQLTTYLPEMVITDLHLNQESGLDLCRYIRSTPRLINLPIMILTSLSTLAEKVAGFEAGADDYVVKPVDAHHLRARIKLLLRIKRLEQHL